jgi:hypothetical protein
MSADLAIGGVPCITQEALFIGGKETLSSHARHFPEPWPWLEHPTGGRLWLWVSATIVLLVLLAVVVGLLPVANPGPTRSADASPVPPGLLGVPVAGRLTPGRFAPELIGMRGPNGRRRPHPSR